MRLIDADALDDIVLKLNKEGRTITRSEYKTVDSIIFEFPTIEAEPVRRGRWVYTGVNTYDLSYGGTAYEPTYRCSACGRIHESYVRLDEPIMPEDADYPNYCPNCGARMEEQE